MKVKIVNKSKHQLPSYETPASAGMDLRANLDEPVVLKPSFPRLTYDEALEIASRILNENALQLFSL